MILEEQLKQTLAHVIKKLYAQQVAVNIDYPADETHGDYTTNVAFILVKEVKKTPIKIAEEIVENFKSQISHPKDDQPMAENFKFFENVEAVKPGFINFWLSKEYLLEALSVKREALSADNNLKGKRIVVEFTDPNPFKEFHIGHVYTNTIGEAICRILEANGTIVWRADYFGDVGMHVAKAIYGILQMSNVKSFDKLMIQYDPESIEGYPISNADALKIDTLLRELTQKPLKERIKYLGKAYAYGSSVYEEDKTVQEEIKTINKLVYIATQKMWQNEKNIAPEIDYQKDFPIDQKKLQRIYDLYTSGRKWSLEYFETIYQRLGMKFDGYYPESIAGERGYKLVKEHIQDGIFEEHDGAIIFRGEKFSLHTRVFINSLGLPTYEAKELGLAPWKYEDFPYNESIVITGNEISEYFKVLIAAMTAINPELGKKTKHLPHGMVRLPEGKMSSRTGKIITGEWLLNEAVKKATDLSKESTNTSEQIGVGAVKYAFLKSGIGKDIEFDFETSLSLNGNSGPYIQYAYTRTQSVIKKFQINTNNLDIKNYQFHPEEIIIMRLFHQFPAKVRIAAEQYAPNIICEYLFHLAKNFNEFYQKYRILDAEKEEEKHLRLLLTTKVGEILKQGLYLLGISAPEKM